MEIEDYIREGANARLALSIEDINIASRKVLESLDNGGKLITLGNGGSAADAQHIAAELAGRFYFDRKALPAISLTTNTSNLTAIANDYSYDDVFSRQMEGIGTKGDIAICISTSGNSASVINAVMKARELGIFTIGLLGKGGGKLKDMVDIPIVVKSDETPIIQEVHIAIGHMICMLVERWMFKMAPDKGMD
jgi:D-sedoheptulose 7-phosphate isomerase